MSDYSGYVQSATTFDSNEGGRQITLYNPDSAKAGILIDGQSLGTGGFGSRVSKNPFMFGIVADVPHGDRVEAEVVSKVLKNIVVIGWAPPHLVVEGLFDGQKYQTRYVAEYVEVPLEWKAAPYNVRVRTERIYYIVFRDDPAKQVHSLVVRGKSSTESAVIEGALMRAAGRVSGIVRSMHNQNINFATYIVAVDLATGKPHASGTGAQTGQICAITTNLMGLSDEALMARVVPYEEYNEYAAIAAATKQAVDATDWRGMPFEVTMRELLAPVATAPVAVIEAPKQPFNTWLEVPANASMLLDKMADAQVPPRALIATLNLDGGHNFTSLKDITLPYTVVLSLIDSMPK